MYNYELLTEESTLLDIQFLRLSLLMKQISRKSGSFWFLKCNLLISKYFLVKNCWASDSLHSSTFNLSLILFIIVFSSWSGKISSQFRLMSKKLAFGEKSETNSKRWSISQANKRRLTTLGLIFQIQIACQNWLRSMSNFSEDAIWVQPCNWKSRKSLFYYSCQLS